MGDSEHSNVASEEIMHPIFCPLCGGKLTGLHNGKKDKCGYDDCHAQFSLRIYDKGLQEN